MKVRLTKRAERSIWEARNANFEQNASSVAIGGCANGTANGGGVRQGSDVGDSGRVIRGDGSISKLASGTRDWQSSKFSANTSLRAGKSKA